MKNWETAKKAKNLVTLAHIQRYEWVVLFVNKFMCFRCWLWFGIREILFSKVRSTEYSRYR